MQHLVFLRCLRDRYDFHVVICQNHPMEHEYRLLAASISTLPSIPFVPRSTNPLRLLRFLRESFHAASFFQAQAKKHQVQLIHSFAESIPSVPLAAKLCGLPSVVQVLGMTIFEPWWVGRIYCTLLNLLTDRFVCCQELTIELLERNGVPRQKCQVVYNGVNTEKLRRFAAELGPPEILPAGRKKVGMVATMDPRKGHLYFIEAAEAVIRTRDDVDFYLIGSTHSREPLYLERLREAIRKTGHENRIHLVGSVEHVAPWIAAMDVYCNSSISEAFSVALVEAMALGRPIVATRVGGNPIAVADGATGLLSKPDDALDMATKILQLLNDDRLRDHYGKVARERADLTFHIEPTSARLSEAFETVLQKRPAALNP